MTDKWKQLRALAEKEWERSQCYFWVQNNETEYNEDIHDAFIKGYMEAAIDNDANIHDRLPASIVPLSRADFDKVREALSVASQEFWAYGDAGQSNTAMHYYEQMRDALALLDAADAGKETT